MAIKQLQLRGISRSPSDRMTADGGLAESLNVFVAEQEQAPMQDPGDASESERFSGKFPSNNSSCKAIYIHKSAYFENLLLEYTYSSQRHIGTYDGTAFHSIFALNDGETFVNCVTLGNTACIVTSERVYYALFKGGEYIPLGSEIPFPDFEFRNIEVAHNADAAWRYKRSPSYSGIVPSINESYIRPLIDAIVEKNRSQGVYNFQQFAILGIELYDGSVITSTPVLLAPGFELPFEVSICKEVRGELTPTVYDDVFYTYVVKMRSGYRIGLKLNILSSFFDNWKDVVKNVKVYLSQEIASTIHNKTHFRANTVSGSGIILEEKVYDYQPGDPGSSTHLTQYYIKVLCSCDEDVDFEKIYTDISQFYCVKTFSLNDGAQVQELIDGLIVDTTELMDTAEGGGYTDHLVLLDPLPLDADMKRYPVRFTKGLTYNKSIVAGGVTAIARMSTSLANHYYDDSIETEDENLHYARFYDVYQPTTTEYITDTTEEIHYRITFYLKTVNGEIEKIKSLNDNGGDIFVNKLLESDTLHPNGAVANAYGFLICPDARVYKAQIEASIIDTETQEATLLKTVFIEMKEHPYLDCSYAYLGMDYDLLHFVNTDVEYSAGKEYFLDSQPEKVYVSDVENPFVFPLASRYTFTGKVIGIAVATRPMSTGQFGQFPLYVFTSDGIWAMETASDGSFVTSKPISREVCINPDSITPLDSSVVYVSDKGVMILTGSESENLSPFMTGRHYTLQTDVSDILLADSNWKPFVSTVTDNTPFMAFMRNAKIAYDYKGERLLFFHDGKPYQYVYMFRSQTWHKYLDPAIFGMATIDHIVLNSYPESIVYRYVYSGIFGYWFKFTQCDNDETTISGLIGVLNQHIPSPTVPWETAVSALVTNNISFSVTLLTTPAADFEDDLEDLLESLGGSGFAYTKTGVASQEAALLDFSTALEDADVLSDVVSPVKGVIISRPFDLGEPDVRKTIKSIRIRGQYNVGDVKYILCGSMDGHHWQRLTSLRGGSYKLFRIILLTNLAPTERITWIDVDYESRFNDKLR